MHVHIMRCQQDLMRIIIKRSSQHWGENLPSASLSLSFFVCIFNETLFNETSSRDVIINGNSNNIKSFVEVFYYGKY